MLNLSNAPLRHQYTFKWLNKNYMYSVYQKFMPAPYIPLKVDSILLFTKDL